MTSELLPRTQELYYKYMYAFRPKVMAFVFQNVPPYSQTRLTRVSYKHNHYRSTYMFLYIPMLYSQQGTARRRAHGGAVHGDCLGEISGFTAKSRGQAVVETGGPRKDQCTLLERGHGRPSKAIVRFGPSHQALVDIRGSTAKSEEFQRVLLEKGVRNTRCGRAATRQPS